MEVNKESHIYVKIYEIMYMYMQT